MTYEPRSGGARVTAGAAEPVLQPERHEGNRSRLWYAISLTWTKSKGASAHHTPAANRSKFSENLFKNYVTVAQDMDARVLQRFLYLLYTAWEIV